MTVSPGKRCCTYCLKNTTVECSERVALRRKFAWFIAFSLVENYLAGFFHGETSELCMLHFAAGITWTMYVIKISSFEMHWQQGWDLFFQTEPLH